MPEFRCGANAAIILIMKSNAGVSPDKTTSQTKLVFAADLGRFRAYRLEENPKFSHPRLVLIEDRETDVTHHLSEDLTDQAGRYRKEPAVPGALSDGEEHHLELERRHRAVRLLAANITALVEHEKADGCYLAADPRIQQSILKELNSATRSKMEKCIDANLSKVSPQELVERFCRE